jgi:predicted ATPase/DNA-binding SARP family transcriptional activator/class 3 adenylate cyclase
MGLRVALLGSLQVIDADGEPIDARLGRREREVVTLLALNAGRVVAVSRLIDELWPEEPPDSAANTVQVYVSRVRKALGPDIVKRDGAGYRLNVAPADVDVNEFERLAHAARGALHGGDFAAAARRTAEALSLWKGVALIDGRATPTVSTEAVRLDELRLGVAEDGFEADLALGDGVSRVADIQALLAEQPFRERLHAALMTALFQGGRHADALAHYSAYRALCVDELGIEPGQPLQDLQSAILGGGDGLVPASTPPPVAIAATPGPPFSALPTGTVTLVFTDVQGSTALLSRLGSGYADALEQMRTILRAAWSDHGGIELGTEGDSFYVVFSTAPAAVAAAVRAQRELTAAQWPADERVLVRMGLHSGAPERRNDAYVGMDVHRAARIASAAHGGQILASGSTAMLVSASLPDGVALQDLGQHHLRDIAAPERLFQVTGVALPAGFGPPKSLGAAVSLPSPPTPTIGRDAELSDLTEALTAPDARLLTLTGPGGAGKTRLAVEAARACAGHFPDGVYFVALAGADVEEAMWDRLAAVMGVPVDGRRPPELFAHIGHPTALVVLDNLEQLADAGRVVALLLDSAAPITVLATSRRALRVLGEREVEIEGLRLPDVVATSSLRAAGAVEMFVQQAKLASPAFELTDDNVDAVVEVCRRLDGLPLGIELAAARVKLLGPSQLLRRIDDVLGVRAAAGARELRHQSLSDTITWSYDLLGRVGQAVFRRLSILDNGDLDAAVALIADIVPDGNPLEAIADLADASLIKVTEGSVGARVTMLETIRAYGRGRLEAAGELEAALLVHARHHLAQSALPQRALLAGMDGEPRHGHDDADEDVRLAVYWILADDGQRIARLLPAPNTAIDRTGEILLDNVAKLLVRMGRWEQAVAVLRPYAGLGHVPVMRELGVALCQLHRSEPHGVEYREGQRLLEEAGTAANGDTDALASLAGTWKGIDDERAQGWYRRCLDVDPSNPYALGNVLEYEVAKSGDLSIMATMRAHAAAGARRCRIEGGAGINLPWAYYDAGKLALLLGRPYEAIASFAVAARLSTAEHMLSTSMSSLERLAPADAVLTGRRWAHRLLALVRAVRFATVTAADLGPVDRLVEAGPLVPVVILAGGTDGSAEDWLDRNRQALVDAFRDFDGVVVSGGTQNGTAGLAATLRDRYGPSITTVGYLPHELPADVEIDPVYDQLRRTDSHDFSIAESLQAWADLVASGVRPSDVRMLAINGGDIAAAEFRIAIALGCSVGVIVGSGREADRLLEDREWTAAPNVTPLEPDASAIRQFLAARST